MHGLTGGNWKRSHDQTMATEKNNSTGNCGAPWLCDLLSIKATAPVPDPPPDVFGFVLPAPGARGRGTEAGWRRGPGAWCAGCRGPDHPNSGGQGLEAKVEPIFHPDSYRYRPGRSTRDAVAACRKRY